MEKARPCSMEESSKRPWGYFEVLSHGADHKVKRIVVKSGGCLSLQRHKKRTEHWYAVAGQGLATIDGRESTLRAGCAVDIPQGAAHRLENHAEADLVVIEIQTGSYFGEDDIERLEDRYGRV